MPSQSGRACPLGRGIVVVVVVVGAVVLVVNVVGAVVLVVDGATAVVLGAGAGEIDASSTCCSAAGADEHPTATSPIAMNMIRSLTSETLIRCRLEEMARLTRRIRPPVG